MRRGLGEWGMSVRWEVFEDGGHWFNEPAGVEGLVRFVREVMDEKKQEKDAMA